MKKQTTNSLRPKRVCAIHDLSSFGRCALTVVIPTLSSLGIQCVPLPTALMSTHTGGYTDIYMRELSSDMKGMYSHWEALGIDFDAIYSGFVLDAAQGHIIADLIKRFRREGTLVLVDPVMGDDGEYYSTCTPEMKDIMGELCSQADLITPNLTEACILCDIEYPKDNTMSKARALEFSDELLCRLCERSPKVAITGIPYTDGTDEYVLTACADAGIGHRAYFAQKKVGASYPGTGELFSSVLLGLLLDGEDFFPACDFSGKFVAETILLSEEYGDATRHGTALEPALMKLAHDTYEKTLCK